MSFDRRTELVEADAETGTFRTTYDYPSNPPSMAVPVALGTVMGTDATDLDPMYRAASVDPDALDELFRPMGNGRPRGGHVTFTYHNFTITVKNYGRIVIRAPDDR